MLFSALCLLALLHKARACTTIVAGIGATEDGSVLASHSNDGEGSTDPRLVKIPAADHAPGSMRPIFFAPETYPRYVGTSRGDIPAYRPVGNQTAFAPIGSIPEVAHTYGYMEETYGALNEYQVGIAESTCSGVFGTSARGHGGHALISVDTLTQLAMERTTSSRAAVQLMGSMAEKYGFYGAGSFEGTAESLLVTDPHEAFVFHILPDPTGRSAIWAAQRVPDNEVAVVANAFILRGINLTDTYNFYGSANMHTVAEAKGWWDPSQGLLDFTKVYSDGEYAHKFYSGRRVWGAYHMMSPSLNFSHEYTEWRQDRPYPVSAPPDKKLTVADVAAVMRSYYQGTQFDQTSGSGLAGGSWGSPDHVVGGAPPGGVAGNWERTIGLFRTSDSYIVQSRSWLPNSAGGVLWFGAHAAPYTVYVPFASGMQSLPDLTLGHPAALDKTSLFWGVRYLANYAQWKWSAMIGDVVALQETAHASSLGLIKKWETATSTDDITAAFSTHAGILRDKIWATSDALMFKYADGFVTTLKPDGSLDVVAQPFPNWWLKAVGYADGPPPVPKRGTVEAEVAMEALDPYLRGDAAAALHNL